MWLVILNILLIDVCYSTSCAKTNISKWNTFQGNHLSHQWEVTFVELTNELIYDVEIINRNKIASLAGNDSSLTPMIFIHGWMDSRLSWMTITPHLLQLISPYQVIIIPTLRGHGDSQIFPIESSTFHYNQYADDLKLLLQKLGFSVDQKFNLIGHSMGGGITIQTTINSPNIINEIILMDTSAAFEDNVKNLFKFDKTKNEPTFEQRKKMAFGFNNPQIDKGWISKELCNIMNRENIKASPMAARESFMQFINVDNTDALINTVNKYSIKSMILFGEDDFVSIPSQTNFAMNINKEIEPKIVQFEDCGHDPHYRHPQRVANVIYNFLYDVDDNDNKQEL